MTREFWVETNAEAQIVRWSDEAPAALGYGSRALFGRSVSRLIVLDRPTEQTLWYVIRGSPVERVARLKPKERRAVPTTYRIERVEDQLGEAILRWTFTITEGSTGH